MKEIIKIKKGCFVIEKNCVSIGIIADTEKEALDFFGWYFWSISENINNCY